MERKPKTVFQLDTPFTRTQIPEISPEHQETILELLCSVLSPIGQYRIANPVSKGKRSKKRKRHDAKLKEESTIPPPPEITPFVVVGLSSIVRKLEELSQHSKPAKTAEISSNPEAAPCEKISETAPDMEKACQSHFSAIFVLSDFSQVLQDHLPQLVKTASLAHPAIPATRLVSLSGEVRVCSALGLQRTSMIGILNDAPALDHLIEYVREHVPEVQVRWLEEARRHEYLPVNLKAIETFGWVAAKGAQKT